MDEAKLEEYKANMQASLEAKLEELFTRRKATPVEELAGPQNFWDLYAIGPYQDFSLEPSRVIELGEWATIAVVVYLNPSVPNPFPGQNACDIITGFGAKVDINVVTSNMQTMTPASGLNYHCCIKTTPKQCWYVCYWHFKPTDPACLYETNICARICNCSGKPIGVPQYSGFVRWVENLDYDMFFGAPQWVFDHPIRFMVHDYTQPCECPD
jgi:hypothetical protein